MSKKTFLLILVGIIVLVGIGAGAYYIGSRNSETVVVTSGDNSKVKEKAKPETKEIKLADVLKALQTEIPTVTQVYEYTEQRDPNGNLGKSGYYVAGANFYDTRTNNEPTDEAFGADAGGAIEVYLTESDAQARVEYLKGFQGNALLDPGAFEQVGKFVLRASTDYIKSQQDEVIEFLRQQVK